MKSARHEDPLIDALAALPPVIPSDRHAARVRARCRERLERVSQPANGRLEPLAIGAVTVMCVSYVLAMVRALLIAP